MVQGGVEGGRCWEFKENTRLWGWKAQGNLPDNVALQLGVEKQVEWGPAHMDGGIPGLGERVGREG